MAGRGRGVTNLPAWMVAAGNGSNGPTPQPTPPPQPQQQQPPPHQHQQGPPSYPPQNSYGPPPTGHQPMMQRPPPMAPPMGHPGAPPRGPPPGSMMGGPPRPPMMAGGGYGGPPPMNMHAPYQVHPHHHQQPPQHMPQQPPPEFPPPSKPPAPAAPMMPTPPPPMTPAAPPPPGGVDPEAVHWKEYKDASGRAYFHDTRTNKTTYEKPLALKSVAERTLAPCKWKEYPSATGKPYYSDGVSSVWSEPPELTEYKAKVAALNAGSSPDATGGSQTLTASTQAAPQSSVGETSAALAAGAQAAGAQATTGSEGKPAGGRKRTHPSEPVVYKNAEERQAAFVAMLRECGITSQHKWGDVNRMCSEEPAWNALTSTGQRKQTFSEYQAKRMKEEKEEKRNKQRKQRDLFLKLLATDTSIDVKTRWREASERLSKDDRYLTLEADVLDEREREEMFNEFVTELARKEDEEKKQQRTRRVEAFNEFLNEINELGRAGAPPVITHTTRWLDVRALLEERHDPRFEATEENERKHVFSDFVVALRKAQEEEQRAKEKERRMEEKQRQAAFKQHLQDRVAEGTITASSTWRDSKLELEKEPTFTALDDSSGGRGGHPARQIFDDVVDALQRAYRSDRKYLRDLLDEVTSKLFTGPAFKLTHETSFDEFTAALSSAEEEVGRKEKDSDEKSTTTSDAKRTVASIATSDHGVSHARMFYDEMIAKEAAAHAEAQRRQKKREERYLELLEDYYYRSDHVDTSWEDAQYDMRKRSAYLDLDESRRREMFDQHMATLAKKLGTKSKKESRKPDASPQGGSKSTQSAAAGGEDGHEGGEGAAAASKKPKVLEDGEEKDDGDKRTAAAASSSDSEDSDGDNKKQSRKESKKKSKKHSKDSKKKSKSKDKEKKKSSHASDSEDDDDRHRSKKRSKY